MFPKQRWQTHVNNQSREPIGQENHVVRHFTFVRRFGAYSMTRILYKYAHLPTLTLFFTFPLTGPIHSLHCDFQREHYHSLISINSSIPPQKCIYHTTILLFVTPFRWDFFSFKNNRNFVEPLKQTNKQTIWEKIRSSKYTLLRFYRKYMSTRIGHFCYLVPFL